MKGRPLSRGLIIALIFLRSQSESLALIATPTRKNLSRRSRIQNKRTIRNAFSDEWQAGDVYRDLDRLEQAINFANKEENLQHMKRIEMLKYSAKQRRPLNPDAKRYILAPLALAFIFRILHEIPAIKLSLRLFTTCMDLHFWTIVVGCPILLLVGKLVSKSEPDPKPRERVEPETRLERVEEGDLLGIEGANLDYSSTFWRLNTDWENPETSSSDHVLFLLEYWVSAVLGMAFIGGIQLLTKFHMGMSIKLWLSIAQFLTRLGAMASLYQYPRQMFELLRSQQPRPLGFFPFLLQYLVRLMFVCAPFGIASDLFKGLIHLQKHSLVALYTSVSTLLFGTWIRMQNIEPGVFQLLDKKSFGQKLVQNLAVLAFWKKPFQNLKHRMQSYTIQCLQRYMRLDSVLTCFSIFCLGLMPILSPIIHLTAVRNLFRIVYTHNLSLALEANVFKASLENEAKMREMMKWRYRLEWRDEKRLLQLLREWKSGLPYWFFREGTVNEKLILDLREARTGRASMEGNHILDRLKVDDMPMFDRDQLKVDAMKRLAEKHQADYESGSYEDPLGVALQQRLGIGLGFKFDHNRRLEEHEKPSIRRLQARAAKSAIKRVNELYDPKTVKDALKDISDRAERNRKAAEIRKQTKDEIEYLAKRLTELVPTSPSNEFEGKQYFQRLTDTSSFRKTSSHEYVREKNPFGNKSVTEALSDRNLGEEKESTASESQSESEDFLEVYLRELEDWKEKGDDNGGGDPPISLV